MKKAEAYRRPDFKPTLEQIEFLDAYIKQVGFDAWFKTVFHTFIDNKELEYKKPIGELGNQEKDAILDELLVHLVQRDEFGVEKLANLGIEPTVFYHWLIYTFASLR